MGRAIPGATMVAASERPSSWTKWKERHPQWPRLTAIEWTLEWLVYWCRNLAIFEFLELAGRLSLIVALVLWFREAPDRAKQKHYRAWDLINSARGSTSDGGRRDALQDLSEDGVSLAGAPLAKAFLRQVNLPRADLSAADLRKAHLSAADLRGADPTGAYLSEAHLTGAHLSWANLSKADLTGADLSRADLTGADLSRADLSKADLSGAQLDGVKF